MDDNLKIRLANAGATKIRFYHYSTPVVNNIFTTCLLLGDNKEVMARGVSICSLLDTYRKKSGNNRAMGRAVKALLGGVTGDIIVSDFERWSGLAVRRSYKAKTQDQEDYFHDEIEPLLNDIIMNWKEVTVGKPGSPTKKFLYYLPLMYPIDEASSFYEFKSEFKPTLIAFEKQWVRNLK